MAVSPPYGITRRNRTANMAIRTAWIDRKERGWVDRLGDAIEDIRPTIVVSGVDKAVEEIIKRAS